MYLDIVILVVLVLAILDGLKNGLFVEFLSVFGLIINFVAAKYFTPILMEFLKFKVNETNYFIIYIIIFWAVYIVMGIFLHFLRNIMDSQNKGFILRILGGLIGSIKSTNFIKMSSICSSESVSILDIRSDVNFNKIEFEKRSKYLLSFASCPIASKGSITEGVM